MDGNFNLIGVPEAEGCDSVLSWVMINAVFSLCVSLRCRMVEWRPELRSSASSADSLLPACSQTTSSIHTPPLRLLPCPYGTRANWVTKYIQRENQDVSVHGQNRSELLHAVKAFVFVCRAVPRWRCIVTGRHSRQTLSAYVPCSRAKSFTDNWATHRLRSKLFVYCTRWVTQVQNTYKEGSDWEVEYVYRWRLIMSFARHMFLPCCSRLAPSRWADVFFQCAETRNLSCPADFDVALCHRASSDWCASPLPFLIAAQPISEEPAVSSLCPLCPSQSGPQVCASREVRVPTCNSNFLSCSVITVKIQKAWMEMRIAHTYCARCRDIGVVVVSEGCQRVWSIIWTCWLLFTQKINME